jgi:hypothetical protein
MRRNPQPWNDLIRGQIGDPQQIRVFSRRNSLHPLHLSSISGVDWTDSGRWVRAADQRDV